MASDRSNLKSRALVFVQFLCLGLIALSSGVVASGKIYLVIEIGAVALGLWAVGAMGFRFSVAPEVRADARLVTDGPYKFIRHPMYTALLIGSLALVLDSRSIFGFTAWLVLALNLWLKLRYEERLLCERFGDYESYSRRTKALIPFVL